MAKGMSWLDLYSAARDSVGPRWRTLRRIDRDDILHSMGLERRNVGADIAGAFGLFCAGALVGAGLGLLFAPKRGTDIRRDLGERVRTTAEKLRSQEASSMAGGTAGSYPSH